MLRKLSVESMEARRLLAADIGPQEEGFHVASEVSANAFADIGNLNGTAIIRSQLGWFNSYDRIGFATDRESDVSIDLGQISADVNLYLTDARGYVIDLSAEWGLSDESIDTRLDAGSYYVWALATSWRSTGYQMELTVDHVPAPVPEPAPSPTAPPGESGGEIAPLTDVAYYGSSYDWGLNDVGAPEAWAAGYTGEGITVAVVDTGVDLDHPDLVANLYVNEGEIAGNGIDDDGNGYVDDLHGYDFADNDSNANDLHGHGTHVAGTIAADDNGFGATGVAPDATILPVKVLGDNGSGSSVSVAAGIRYAADMGADIINLSLGGGYSADIESAISYAQSLGSFIVAAAGNESASVPGFPAQFSTSYDNVLSVGAHDSNSNIASFSNAVGSSGSVQIDAPGVGIYSTYVGGRYAMMSGTSMATPHVAGIAALTLSADPSLTSPALRDLLVSGAFDSANGSDAIGKASTLYSVAYAAAGVSGSSNGASSSGSTSYAGDSGSVNAASADAAFAMATDSRTDRNASTDDDASNDRWSDFEFGQADEVAGSIASNVSAPSSTDLDDYLSALSEDDEADFVADPLESALLAIA